MPSINRRGGEEAVDPVLRTTAFTAIPERVYRLDATAGSFNVHLPTASGIGGLDILLYAEHDSGNVINIVPSGVENILGASGLALNAREAVQLTSNDIDDWIAIGV